MLEAKIEHKSVALGSYKVLLDKMQQVRSDDPTRRRKVRRVAAPEKPKEKEKEKEKEPERNKDEPPEKKRKVEQDAKPAVAVAVAAPAPVVAPAAAPASTTSSSSEPSYIAPQKLAASGPAARRLQKDLKLLQKGDRNSQGKSSSQTMKWPSTNKNDNNNRLRSSASWRQHFRVGSQDIPIRSGLEARYYDGLLVA